MLFICVYTFFFVNETATTEIYTYLHTLSLHDALPIFRPREAHTRRPVRLQCQPHGPWRHRPDQLIKQHLDRNAALGGETLRSEEHTSELQSLMRISYAVFCLKKKTKNN